MSLLSCAERCLGIAGLLVVKVITAGSGTALTHPGVHVFFLELPEASNLVPRHALGGHPGVDGVFGYAEVVGDFIDREPAVVHDSSSWGQSPGRKFVPV